MARRRQRSPAGPGGRRLGRAPWQRANDGFWHATSTAILYRDVNRHEMVDGRTPAPGGSFMPATALADDTADKFFVIDLAAGVIGSAHYHRTTHHLLGAVSRR